MALIDKASLLMVPSTYEAGTLYNVLPSGNRAPDSTDQNSGYDQTRADFSFDRGSNAAATRVNADGLIEKYRENLLLQSNQFDQSWVNTRSSESSGFEGYDGTNNAWKLKEDNNNGTHKIVQSITQTGIITASLYAKAGERSAVQFILESGGSYAGVNFDLTDGSVQSSPTSTFTLIDSNSIDVGNGWYRLIFAANVTSSASFSIYTLNASFSTSYQGVAGEGVYIQNAQLETGLVATDYLDSGATTAKAGVLIDLPRINYDANGENGALLLEPSRLNLLPQTEYFGASWFASNINIETNATTSPEGVQNATTIENTSASNYLVYSASVTASTKYVFSFYVKNIDATAVNVIFYDSTNSAVISTTAYENDLTTDWKRLDFEVTTPAGCVTLNVNLANGLSGSMNIWGAQLEAGSYVSSYIPNHGTSGGVTRAADSCSVTGVSDVIGQTEGTMFVEATLENIVVNKTLLRMGQSSSFSNSHILQVINQKIYAESYVNSANQAEISTTAFSHGDKVKIAYAYKQNDYALYVNGSQIGTDTNANVPSSIGTLYVGNITATEQHPVEKATLFKERLSNAELATLTTL